MLSSEADSSRPVAAPMGQQRMVTQPNRQAAARQVEEMVQDEDLKSSQREQGAP
ncbi:hypothetical protein ABBQ38_012468 [Trebouxia sp. C0009 RCD-2024]